MSAPLSPLSVLGDIGLAGYDHHTVADIIEVVRPLRNCIAHNAVIFDARFSQAVSHGQARPVAAAGAIIEAETDLSYAPQFNSIVDYVLFLAMLVAMLTRRKTDARRFVREGRRELDTLKAIVGIDMYMKIVGSGDRQKLDAAMRFISGR